MLDNNILIIFAIFLTIVSVKAFDVDIKLTGSSVSGAYVNFTATLYNDGMIAGNDNYAFKWNDNADPQHSTNFKTEQPYSNWSIEYPKETKPGLYEVNLNVEKKMIFWYSIAQKSVLFKVTELLNGNMSLTQNGTVRQEQYVSARDPVSHTIALKNSDIELLKKNATYIQTFWFENCTYVGVTDGFTYVNRYPHIGSVFNIEALVVASYDKLPTPVPSTTTSSTTTKPNPTISTTVSPTIIPVASNAITLMTSQHRAMRDLTELISNFNILTASENAKLLGIDPAAFIEHKSVTDDSMTLTTANFLEVRVPYVCFNKSMVAANPKKTYGYFNRSFVTLLSVGEFSSSGKNWLQHGDVLNLNLSCKGSPPLEYCYSVYDAPYTTTGNETCLAWNPMIRCSFQLRRWFSESKTILFFVRNPVATSVNQVTINFYETKKKSQLSVIVVPVSFSLVAVTLIVFGVSYYIQNRNRFNVEVADFNFGETDPVDMEYKTFHQRLIESLCDAIQYRDRSESSEFLSDSSPIENEGERQMRYNSMT